MSLRKVSLVTGEYFHVYNRGNSKQEIFLDDEDRERFVKFLFIHNTDKSVRFRDDIIKPRISAWDFEKGNDIVSIGAWTLMPNHFHLYVSSPRSCLGLEASVNSDSSESNNIGDFMRKVCTSYSMYFNKKYNRTGSLFEAKFKAVHISDEVQAKYLFSYIHLNPIKLIFPNWKDHGIKDKTEALKFLGEYKWSSYLDHKGVKRSENKIIDRKNFVDYFPEVLDFDKEIFDWINLNG